MSRIQKVIVTALFIGGLFGFSAAGEIDYGLEQIMNSLEDDQQISILVYLEDQVNLKSLSNELRDQSATLAYRHETVVRALQQKATLSQPALISYLDDMKMSGGIDDYQAYWVANVIRVNASKNAIDDIASRSDVAKVYYNYEIELIEPVESKEPEPGLIAGVETGLEAVRAPEVWAMGITGQGVLVANIDTGVEGDHPALASRWAGIADPRYAGHPEWAWFDPYLGQNDFPYDSHGHGTHTMGTITGADNSSGDTVGVAPGALWIAAGAIDRGGGTAQTVADAIASFQWMVDPDGNPSTDWDVPDICSNSWGVGTVHGYPPCDSLFWSYIDACEAAGTVVLFSAGNEGAAGLRRPAERATDEYTNCAVAAVDANTAGWPIASFSSRGPTYCTPDGSAAIKPDIAGPGVNVRSCYPGHDYTYLSGTSMSCPHVAGVAALIREANPNLDVEQIKDIMYQTAYDLGAPGEDNDYGWGMVDAYEAVMLALSGTPPNAEFSASPRSGCAPLTVDFIDESTHEVTSWFWDFGDGGTSPDQNPTHTYQNAGKYTVSLTATGPEGSNTETRRNYIIAYDDPVAAFAVDHTSGCAPLRVGFSDQTSGLPTNWNWDFGDQGTSGDQNPDHVYYDPGLYTVTLTAWNDCSSDMITMTDYIQVDSCGPQKAFAAADFPRTGTVIGDYTNTHQSDNVYQIIEEIYAGAKPSKSWSYLDHRWIFDLIPSSNLTFNVEAYRPDNPGGDDFAFEYSIDNFYFTRLLTVASPVEQVYTVAMPDGVSGTIFVRVMDTDLTMRESDLARVYIDQLYFEYSAGSPPPLDTLFIQDITVTREAIQGGKYRGVAVVTIFNQDNEPMPGTLVRGVFFGPGDDYVGSWNTTGPDGTVTFYSPGVRNPVGTWCFFVDIVRLGDNIYDPSRNVETFDCEEGSMTQAFDGLPRSYDLIQNYPNPFNASTTIEYALPEQTHVSLEIYNLLGSKIETIVNEVQSPGYYRIIWNADEYSSGIYFYRISTENYAEIKKMVLMK